MKAKIKFYPYVTVQTDYFSAVRNGTPNTRVVIKSGFFDNEVKLGEFFIPTSTGEDWAEAYAAIRARAKRDLKIEWDHAAACTLAA